jgi:ribonuclease BN (tRNA processing enzyme)
LIIVAALVAAGACAPPPEPDVAVTAGEPCSAASIGLQVLGSGGPFSENERASSSYLLWIDGQARVMVDAGGGTRARFGASGARLQDLQLLAVSHLHPDHVSDLPALLWMSQLLRTSPLPIAGPSGDDRAVGTRAFLDRMFSADGAFSFMAGSLDGQSPAVVLEPTEVDVGARSATLVLDADGVRISALGVPHNVPTLAYRVEFGEVAVVFAGDQNGSNPVFVDFARGADVLVMHLAISESSTLPIHPKPSVVGRIATEAGIGRLVLSHLSGIDAGHPMAGEFSLSDLAASLAAVEASYAGELIVAEDLMCVPLR